MLLSIFLQFFSKGFAGGGGLFFLKVEKSTGPKNGRAGRWFLFKKKGDFCWDKGPNPPGVLILLRIAKL